MKTLIEEYGIFILEAIGCITGITLLYQILFNANGISNFIQSLLVSLVG